MSWTHPSQGFLAPAGVGRVWWRFPEHHWSDAGRRPLVPRCTRMAPVGSFPTPPPHAPITDRTPGHLRPSEGARRGAHSLPLLSSVCHPPRLLAPPRLPANVSQPLLQRCRHPSLLQPCPPGLHPLLGLYSAVLPEGQARPPSCIPRLRCLPGIAVSPPCGRLGVARRLQVLPRVRDRRSSWPPAAPLPCDCWRDRPWAAGRASLKCCRGQQ